MGLSSSKTQEPAMAERQDSSGADTPGSSPPAPTSSDRTPNSDTSKPETAKAEEGNREDDSNDGEDCEDLGFEDEAADPPPASLQLLDRSNPEDVDLLGPLLPLLSQPVRSFIADMERIMKIAEDFVCDEQLSLTEAKNFVQAMRDLVQRYTDQGVQRQDVEAAIFTRAMTVPLVLIQGVQNGVEEYDPRQTSVFMFCVLSVLPKCIWLEKNTRGLMYRFSSQLAFQYYDRVVEIVGYCKIKTDVEGPYETKDFMQHQQLLLDLATWLDRDRPVVVFFMMTAGFTDVKNRIIALRNAPRNPFFAMFGLNSTVSNLQRMFNTSDVLKASSLVRTGFMDEAEEHNKFLRKVNANSLPPQLGTRLVFVQASLLLHCGILERAMENAQIALGRLSDKADRSETENLIKRIKDAVAREKAQEQRRLSNVPDMEWLEGTNISQTQMGARRQQEARQSHHKKPKRSRPRRPSPDCRSQLPSPAPPPERRGRERHDSGYPPYRQARVSVSPDSGSSFRSESLRSSGMTQSRDSIPNVLNLEDDDFKDLEESEDEDDERDLRRLALSYGDLYDTDDNDSLGDEEMVPALAVEPQQGEETGEETDQDWFDKSVRAVQQGEDEEDVGVEVELSDNQLEALNKGGRGKAFYPDILINEGQLEALLKQEPDRFKRCQLKIEFSHRSIAKILTKETEFTEILIMGRSKCGRTYMDDEVVVEVLAKPGESKGLLTKGKTSSDEDREALEHMAFGQVIGYFPSKRANYAGVDHPVLFCTVDELEGHLMKPLCRTVPKIHVMNDNVRKKYPALLKNRIEIKKISPGGDVEHKGYFNIQPEKRQQYVFRVVILSWRQQNIYPLGAVLEAFVGGKNYASGLEVLKLQQRVPRLYPQGVIEETESLLEDLTVLKNGRLDLTKKQVFTIDPPRSRDLDDALSVWKEGPHYIVGVHIADVSAVVSEGSRLDKEARKRAVTFYPLDRKPHPMLPEPLSHNKCSLLEGKERYALSVFFKFNAKGNQVADPVIRKTVVKSTKQLSYLDAQKVIKDDPTANVCESLRTDIRALHDIAQKLRKDRFQASMLYVPFEDPRLKDLEDLEESPEAHALVEELMVLTNAHIARHLTSLGERFRSAMILRCHKAPTWEDLAKWRESEGSMANLVMRLQGKNVSPDTKLSVEAHRPGVLYQKQHIVVQEELWLRLSQHLEDGELEEARRIAFMDDLHSLQCLANNHWMDLMETAQYRCSHGLNQPDHYHFGLGLQYYTHFTSPIRRYADLHVHRLLHAHLDGTAPKCSPDDVTHLCQHINSATARQKAFGKGCLSLKIAESLQRQPLVFRCFVDQVDSEQLTLTVPSLRAVSDRKQEVPFGILGVSSQPDVSIDSALNKTYVTVQWNRRIYNEHGTCPGDFKVKREAIERRNRKSTAPLVMDVNPHIYSVHISESDWAAILKSLATNTALPRVPLPVEVNQPGVNYMSSEKGDGTVSLRQCFFKTVYSPGQVLQVQLSAEPRKGVLQPRVDLLHTARNASVCTEHVREPVLSLTRHGTRATREQQFKTYREYVRAWMPLLEMEAAFGAGATDDVVVVENVPVLITPVEDTDETKRMFTGSFSLNAKFCFDRCIEFGGKSPDSIRESTSSSSSTTNTSSSYAFPLDYLCIRFRTQCPDSVVSRVKRSPLPQAVDRHYTWIGHAGVVAAKHKGKKEEDGGHLHVTFVLSHSTPQPPQELMTGDGDKVTLEILPKSAVDRRAQQMLLDLENEDCKVARAIAFGSKMPKLDKERVKLGQKDENQEVLVPKLPRNNPPQLDAIRTALTNTVSLIQGPPGTGKTYTGIKLVYLFCKINRQLEREGKGKKMVLFCGPSNKSVDLVARLLKDKLGPRCPKILRVYGSAIESKDYPVPRGNLRSTRGMRDLKSDPELTEVTLHHIIRESGKPYAEQLAEFERFFELCRSHPETYQLDSKAVKKYRKILHEASVEEMVNYEVLLTTCGVAGNRRLIEGTEGNIFQVIIDECAMVPEPHSLVPIIATQAKQVVLIGDHKQLRPIITCQAAADLGLEQSLFERLYNMPSSKRVFLSTQYRMHPQICAFPSSQFYEGKLETSFSHRWGDDALPLWPHVPWVNEMAPRLRGDSHQYVLSKVPHILVDVRGEEDTLTVTTDEGNERSKSNQLEADKVVEIFTFLKRDHKVETPRIRVLTQYNAQRHLIDDKLKKLCEDRSQTVFDRYDRNKIEVSTVVSSQGGEWDYVILSTVRSLPSYKIEPNPTYGWCRQNLGFITDKNQVNVALTRARKGLIIVGNKDLLRCDEVWRKLVERYEKMNCVREADDFPPPPPPRSHHKKRPPVASLEWQQA